MALSTVSKGCIGIVGALFLLPFLMIAVEEGGSWAHRTFGPRPTPAPTKTAVEIAREQVRQRDAAERKEKLRQVIARQEAEAARKREATEAAWLRTSAGRLWKKHKDWDRAECETIAQGKVHIGMTMDQARAAWGNPESVHNTTYALGVTSQWCYGEYCQSALYFDNGTLTTIQN